MQSLGTEYAQIISKPMTSVMTLKLRILNTNAVPHSNIDKQICYNTIIEIEIDENVSFSNEV